MGASDLLIKTLRELPLDGGTALNALNFAETDADLILVISDGLSNFGGHEPRIESGKADSPRVVLLHAAQARPFSSGSNAIQ